MNDATLRLFRAIQIQEPTRRPKFSADNLKRTMKYGYVADPAIPISKDLFLLIEETVGLSSEQANQAFHKSWETVKNISEEKHAFQQMVHYMTTYGMERFGEFNQDTVYIPIEELDLPEISLGKLPLIVIKGMTKEEILEKIIQLGSGIALSEEVLDDIMEIVTYNNYDSSIVEHIQNRELKIRLYTFYGTVPQDPEEYVRYLITRLTGESLVIKNKELIGKIETSDRELLDQLISKAPADLGSVFYRFKPLFLAMKKRSNSKHFFNKLRRRARKIHQPMPVDYLNDVTGQIKRGELSLTKLEKKLRDASLFRKIRLGNALCFRSHGVTGSIVYQVRNGRGWATTFNDCGDLKTTWKALDLVTESIAQDLVHLEGKTIYIPEWINYTLPATEKQFTGNFPSGTSVNIQGDTLVGIHWVDTNHRIDLDLSVLGISGKIGWDSAFRSDDLRVLFSGDMTSAPKPKGASELFYFNGIVPETKLIMVNFYNYAHPYDKVDCGLFVAQESVKSLRKNHMVDPQNILARSEIPIDRRQNVIGLIVPGNKVYFSQMSVGNSISSRYSDVATRTREFLVASSTCKIELKTVLGLVGANVVTERSDDDYVDLHPSALNKATFLELLDNS